MYKEVVGKILYLVLPAGEFTSFASLVPRYDLSRDTISASPVKRSSLGLCFPDSFRIGRQA
jgi:hypothetical protein